MTLLSVVVWNDVIVQAAFCRANWPFDDVATRLLNAPSILLAGFATERPVDIVCAVPQIAVSVGGTVGVPVDVTVGVRVGVLVWVAVAVAVIVGVLVAVALTVGVRLGV
jgi:hypothetical protein